MRRYGWVWLLWVGLALLAACRHPPDEQQVRDAIAAGAAAVEEADAGDFGKLLAEDFDGNRGEADARYFANLMRVARLRDEHPTVLVGPISTETRDGRIRASFTATIGGRSSLVPERLGVYQVESWWRKDGGRWRCYNASWERKL